LISNTIFASAAIVNNKKTFFNMYVINFVNFLVLTFPFHLQYTKYKHKGQ